MNGKRRGSELIESVSNCSVSMEGFEKIVMAWEKIIKLYRTFYQNLKSVGEFF